MFSSPPLPSGVGSTKTFQRPLLPVSKTRYTVQEQYDYHRKHLKQLQAELMRLETAAGASHNNYFNSNSPHINISNHNKQQAAEKHFDKDKYSFLQYEVSFSYKNLL
jgi:hypothetical protein